MEPLRVHMVTNRYLPIMGGAERQLALLASALKIRGHPITIVTRRITNDLPLNEMIDDIPVRRLRPTGLGKLANALIIPRLITYLIVHRNDFDIIHCQSIGPAALASIIAGQWLNKPVIIRVAGAGNIARQEAGKQLSMYTRLMRQYIITPERWRRFLSKASAIVVLSQEIYAEAERFNLGSLIKLIPNSVDLHLYAKDTESSRNALRQKLGLPDDVPIIFNSSRLVVGKRLDVLIDAIPAILQNNADVLLLIAGTGSHQMDSVEKALKDKVSVLGLDHRIRFLGLVDNVADYLKAADVFAFPSVKEGMPNAVLEAMAAGVPIVASRIGGVIDLVDDTCADLLPVGDVEGFAQSIIHILNHPEVAEAKATQAQQRVQTQFSVDVMVDTYLQLYTDLIDANS